MAERARLLMLTPRLPYPVVGGDRLRIYHIARTLAEHVDLTLVSLVESREELNEPVDGVFREVHRVLLPPWRSRLHSALAVPTQTPLQVAYYRCQAFADLARHVYPGHHGVFAHLIRTDAAARLLPGPRFLEMTDAISLNYQRVRSETSRTAGRDPRVWIYALEYRRLRAFERRVTAAYEASFLVSDVDRRYLFGDQEPRGEILVCPNGVDLERMPFAPPEVRAEPVAVFIGNLCSLQNFDAAYRMAVDVMPDVRLRCPEARLRVIGRIPADKAAVLRALPGVEVTGEVPDVAAAARGASVGVAPMALGAGVQNKVLEYQALGLATIVTPVALEGLSAVPGRDLEVADLDNFASAVARLFEAPAHRAELAYAGRRFVLAEHQWAATLAPMVQRVVRGVERRRRGQAQR
ncbi:MAG: glycosyltransferase family 4 protein [Dermatophilaceae bacterium]